jgi:hypothetical protein
MGMPALARTTPVAKACHRQQHIVGTPGQAAARRPLTRSMSQHTHALYACTARSLLHACTACSLLHARTAHTAAAAASTTPGRGLQSALCCSRAS